MNSPDRPRLMLACEPGLFAAENAENADPNWVLESSAPAMPEKQPTIMIAKKP